MLTNVTQKNVLRCAKNFSDFVPKHSSVGKHEKFTFYTFLDKHDKILVLTGAGVSTESGIPDYRSAEVGLFARSTYKPIQYNDFLKNPEARVRYWARNYVGWPRFSQFSPNKTHNFLFQLETMNKSIGIITQNVDGLHSKAGCSNVVELHGNAYWVQCLQCKHLISRYDFQSVLEKLNPDWSLSSDVIRPDGDVHIPPEKVKEFNLPDCEKCGGILKPTIVFFGDNVPEKRVKKVEQLVEKCDALLVLGTSLSTLSSYRIVNQAYDLNKAIIIINIGPTRGDKFADLRINCKCGDIMPKVISSLGGSLSF